MPQKKNPDIAELARGKAGRLIGNLDRPAGHAQGAAAGLQPRPAGGQGAGLRLRRHPRGAAAGVHRHGRDADLRHRADGRARPAGLLARHRRRRVAGPRGRAVPGGPRGRRRLRTPLRGARHRARRAHRRAARRRSTPRLTPAVREVLTVEGSVASRDGRGGTAPDRVREQLAELRAAVAEPPRTGCGLTCGRSSPARCSRWRRGCSARPCTHGGRGRAAHRGRGVRRRRRPGLARLPRADRRATR